MRWCPIKPSEGPANYGLSWVYESKDLWVMGQVHTTSRTDRCHLMALPHSRWRRPRELRRSRRCPPSGGVEDPRPQ